MIVLRLSNSADSHASVAELDRSRTLGAAATHEATGEAVTTIVRGLWPAKHVPDLIDGWLTEYEPDAVLLWVNPYWFTSVGLPAAQRSRWKLVRLTGKFAKRVGLKSQLVYQTGKLRRRVLVARQLGKELFEPDEVIAVVEACVRRILRHEQVALVVRGPMYPVINAGMESLLPRGEARRLVVHRAVRALCADVHVPYFGTEDGIAYRHNHLAHDGIHQNELAHAEMASEESGAYISAWREQHP